jgi:hypothetical protein
MVEFYQYDNFSTKEPEMTTKGKVKKPAAEKTAPAPTPTKEATPAKEATPKKTKPAKATPAKKPPAKEVSKPIDTGKFAADSKIKVLVEANPKREGSESYKRFALYKDGMTVEEALTKGLTRPDLAWDTKHQFISIG